jgi:hypothetical protein
MNSKTLSNLSCESIIILETQETKLLSASLGIAARRVSLTLIVSPDSCIDYERNNAVCIDCFFKV